MWETKTEMTVVITALLCLLLFSEVLKTAIPLISCKLYLKLAYPMITSLERDAQVRSML